MIEGKKISLLIPCHNEEEGLLEMLRNDLSFIDEKIIIDNNCTDGTAEVAIKNGCRVIKELKSGYGAAYKAGFQHVSGEIVITMDGDNTYPISEIKKLVEILISNKLDFISANRFGAGRPDSMNFINYLGNYLLTLGTKALFLRSIKDSQSGMWVFRRHILDKLKLKSDGMAMSEEIKIEVLKKGFNFQEVDIEYNERFGETKLNKWRDGLKNLAFLFYKRIF